MFIGILGRSENLPDELIVKMCYRFAEEFEEELTSLKCTKRYKLKKYFILGR